MAEPRPYRRRRAVRARTYAARGPGRHAWPHAARAEGESEQALRAERPRTRSDCQGGERPCPWVSCRYHLALDVHETGAIKLNFPDLEVWEIPDTCSLDVADRELQTRDEVGAVLNITRERVRQIEMRIVRILHGRGWAWLGVARRGLARRGGARQGPFGAKERAMEETGKRYFGGLPTAPDVRRLVEAFPTWGVGECITYDAVAQVLGVERTSGRFRAVTKAWRDHLRREQNFCVEAVAGRCFRRLPEAERSMSNAGRTRRAVRQIGRATVDQALVVTTDLTADERGRHDHRLRHMIALTTTAREHSRELTTAPAAHRSLPRPKPEA